MGLNVRVLLYYPINPFYGGLLTIVDASPPDNLVETAWVVMGKSLVWDADPYLPSGIVFATAKNEGLFIYAPTYRRAAYLEGHVRDAATGQPLAGATVAFKSEPNSGVTNVEGLYKTGVAKAGDYILEITKDNYQPIFLTDIQLKNGETTVLDIALTPLASANEEANAGARVSVYPTCFEDQLTVVVPEQGGAFTATLTSAAGKLVFAQPLGQGTQTLRGLARLPKGVYVLRVEKEGRLWKAVWVEKM